MENKFEMKDSIDDIEVKEEVVEEEVENLEEQPQEEVKEEVENLEEQPKEEPEKEKKEEHIEPKNNNVTPPKNDKTKVVVMVIAIIVLVVAILGVTLPSVVDKITKEEKVIKNEPKEVKSEYRMTGNNLQEFDISFLKLENEGKNAIYSPLSIKYALEMLAEGTSGESKKQIEAIIGDYAPKKYMNNANMSFANAMFINQLNKEEIKESYTTVLKDKYDAEVVYDSFESATLVNDWVYKKTLGLIDNLLNDSQLQDKKFLLINALAIDMEWNKKIQADAQSREHYVVSFLHEDYHHSIYPIAKGAEKEMDFNNGQQKVNALEIGATINKYDIVEDLGEDNIRAEITKEYNEFVATGECGPQEETATYVEKFIKELDSNYGQYKTSTDFEFYIDDNTKMFAKDLKTYEGITLQYIGIMPTKDTLVDFVDKTTAEDYNKLFKSLKKVEPNNFKEGVVTKVIGYIPTFKFNYDLKLEKDLRKLGVTDIFDPKKADLSAMTEGKGNYITDAVHKATIEFTNDGIKAAAVTMLGGAGSAFCGFEHLYEVPVEVIDLSFDKPYVFFIRDKATNEIWFTGTVAEPDKSLRNN